MKKMKITAVLVLMMSATNAFADADCAVMKAEIDAGKNRIVEAQAEIEKLDELFVQNQTLIITNDNRRKNDSFILGYGQETLQQNSIIIQKARANYAERIAQEQTVINALTESSSAAKCE